MIITRTIRELRECLLPARVARQRIGLVPTMGAFHEGHLHLMHTARDECGISVVSAFVNPTQFGDVADLAAYPSDHTRDALLATEVGVDVLFAPSVAEMYPNGFDTLVEVGGAARVLEGAARGVEHFRGVTTVVSKLFNIVQPHIAYFGQKDFQQTVVIRQLVRDLDMPVEIAVCPTIREPDGLAMSSRNTRLSASARTRALAISEALHAAQHACTGGETETATLRRIARDIMNARGFADTDIDYLATVNMTTLTDVSSMDDVSAADDNLPDERVVMAVAARVDGVRLIDNVVLNERAS